MGVGRARARGEQREVRTLSAGCVLYYLLLTILCRLTDAEKSSENKHGAQSHEARLFEMCGPNGMAYDDFYGGCHWDLKRQADGRDGGRREKHRARP